jgi:hypothetical protein
MAGIILKDDPRHPTHPLYDAPSKAWAKQEALNEAARKEAAAKKAASETKPETKK